MTDVITMDTVSEAVFIQEAVDKLVGPGFRIHPNAHLSLETLENLVTATNYGNVAAQMVNNLDNTVPLSEDQIPVILREAVARVEKTSSEGLTQIIKNQVTMTRLANDPTTSFADPFTRLEYQEAERKNMKAVINSLKPILNDYLPARTLGVKALRGAKFFDSELSEFVVGKISSNVKRIKLVNNDTGDTEYGVGMSDLNIEVPFDINEIEQIVSFEDCMSSGISQVELFEQMFKSGLRPKRIVLAVVGATTDGINFFMQKTEEWKEKYGDFEFVLGCASVCERVNEDIYLMTLDGQYFYGDIGDANVTVPAEVREQYEALKATAKIKK